MNEDVMMSGEVKRIYPETRKMAEIPENLKERYEWFCERLRRGTAVAAVSTLFGKTAIERIAALEAALKEKDETIKAMRRAHNEEMRDAARDARESVAEALWQARQGDDYGSY